jgi:hypothetical protein
MVSPFGCILWTALFPADPILALFRETSELFLEASQTNFVMAAIRSLQPLNKKACPGHALENSRAIK